MNDDEFTNIGMSPAVWGPIFWTTMHIASLGYSDTPTQEESLHAIQFYESLQNMIPCPICKEHYRLCLEKMPVRNAVASRKTLIRWVFNIHNNVNVQLGKKELTFQEYIQKMTALSHLRSLNLTQANYNNYVYGGLFFGGLLVGIMGTAYSFSRN